MGNCQCLGPSLRGMVLVNGLLILSSFYFFFLFLFFSFLPLRFTRVCVRIVNISFYLEYLLAITTNISPMVVPHKDRYKIN